MLWLCLGFSKLTCTKRPYSPGRRCSHSFYITLLCKLSPASCRHKAPRFKSVEQDSGSRCGPRDGAVRTSRWGHGPPRPVWTDPEPTPLLRRKHSPGGCKLELIHRLMWGWPVFRRMLGRVSGHPLVSSAAPAQAAQQRGIPVA